MGDGVTGSVNAPVNQTPNTGNSGATSRADAAAKAEFGQVLAQEQCPPGLGRPPHVGSFPSRFDPPCTYLKPPSQEPPKPVGIPRYEGNGDNSQSPIVTTPTGPDRYKPIPPAKEKEFDPPVYHTGGMGTLDGAHIGGVKGKF